ncbi:MAG: hypothetical protein ABI995_03620 [Acidobacteriota bacterium]
MTAGILLEQNARADLLNDRRRMTTRWDPELVNAAAARAKASTAPIPKP